MKSRLLVLMAGMLVLAFASSGYCEEAKSCELIGKLHTFVNKMETIALYETPATKAKESAVALMKEYSEVFGKAKELAAKGDAPLKEALGRLAAFQANTMECAKCSRSYRALFIDLVAYEQCKKKSCVPFQKAVAALRTMAYKCKSGK